MRATFQVARQFGLPQAEGGIATATSLRSGDHRETMKSRASHSEKAFARAVGATPIERLTKPLSRVQRERSGGRVLLLATAVRAPSERTRPGRRSYFVLWKYRFTIGFEGFVLSKSILL